MAKILPISNLKVINIEPTSKCNLNCSICSDKHTRPQGNMRIKVYEKIVEELGEKCPEVQVNLFLSGEPLLYKGLDKLISLGYKYGLHKFLIHTNAILITKPLAEKLIDAGLTHISFSIDGGDKKSYEKIRGIGNYEKAVKGTQKFLNVNNGFIHTTIQVIKKYPELLEVSEKFRNQFPGVNQISIRHPHSWSIAGSIKEAKPIEYPTPCFFLFEYFNVYWNGDCPICCADLSADYVIGNVKDYEVEDLYNSEAMQYLRETQKNNLPVDKRFPCAKCERYGF